jgi:hypothetical protein
MATSCIAPQVKMHVEEKLMPVSETRPAGLKQRIRDLLVAIFEGHEEFLGWTPD